jgi:DNA-binding transcriptional LysR family regulator
MIPPPEDLVVTILGSQPLLLHVAGTHPLAERDRVDLGELADEHFIAGPPTYHVRTELDNYCRAAGFDPYIAFEISEFDTIRALVAQGLGIALLPRAEISQPGVATVQVSGIADRPIGLAMGTRHPSPATLRLLTHVTTRAQWPLEP